MISSDNATPSLIRGRRVRYDLHKISPNGNPGDTTNDNPPTVAGGISSTGGAAKSRLHSREKLKSRRRGPDRPRRISDHIHVRAYHRPSWFSARGVHAKRKLIESKGMPDLHNWRFITLTINPERFESPEEAYLFASDHMRRFLYACRKEGLWTTSAKWCWKLEFHASGWPHWHLLVERTAKFTHEELRRIDANWGLGRTNVERVNERGFRYNFKYAFKAVAVEGDEGEPEQFAPDWFLDHQRTKPVEVVWTDEDGVEHRATEMKPVTFSRVRFWQTSRGFYTGRKKEQKEREEQSTWVIPRNAREVHDDQNATVQVVARLGNGDYQGSMCVRISGTLEHFWNLVGFDTIHAGAVGLAVKSFVIPTHRITTDPKTLWKLQPLLKRNRLTLRHAQLLQQRGETLRTC